MKKEYRVKKNQEFQRIIDTGKYKSCKFFVMYYAPAIQQHDRIGISVGKKLGNAVVRNKVKRQVRMMVDEIFDFNSSYDYIIIVRNRYHNQDFEANKKELSLLALSVYNNKDKPKGE